MPRGSHGVDLVKLAKHEGRLMKRARGVIDGGLANDRPQPHCTALPPPPGSLANPRPDTPQRSTPSTKPDPPARCRTWASPVAIGTDPWHGPTVADPRRLRCRHCYTIS